MLTKTQQGSTEAIWSLGDDRETIGEWFIEWREESTTSTPYSPGTEQSESVGMLLSEIDV